MNIEQGILNVKRGSPNFKIQYSLFNIHDPNVFLVIKELFLVEIYCWSGDQQWLKLVQVWEIES
jgi:hypothetical protein